LTLGFFFFTKMMSFWFFLKLTRATWWPGQNPEPGPRTGPATGPDIKTRGGTPHSLNNESNYEIANLANKLLEKTIINLSYESWVKRSRTCTHTHAQNWPLLIRNLEIMKYEAN
jgi:hypothetical protein